MAGQTLNFKLYNWSATDKLTTTIPQISSNFDALERILSRQGVDLLEAGAKADWNASTKTGTDASGVLQRLLNLAKDPKASINIFVPTGTYRLAQELKIYSNTAIVCAPGVTFIRDHSKYLMMNGFRSNEATPSNFAGYTGYGNIQIIGGTWDGNGTNQTTKASIFHLGHGDGITVSGATFKDVATSHHIEFNACKNVRVDASNFLGMAGLAVSGETYNECIQLDLSKTGVTTIGSADNTPCKNVWITRCYFGNSGTSGSGSIGRAVGSHTSTIGRQHENITIDNCIVENSQTWAFRAYNWKNVTITNNNMINCGQGINIRAAIAPGEDVKDASGNTVGAEVVEYGNISGNTITGGCTVGRAIEVYGEDGSAGKIRGYTVDNNSINIPGSSLDGIIFRFAEQCTCVGNRIVGAKRNGIMVSVSCSEIDVQANTIDDSGEDGIEVSDSNYILVDGNIVKRSGNCGIYISAGEGQVINANIISGVNGKSNTPIADFGHIRLVSGVKKAVISANVCRTFSTTHVGNQALWVTNTCYDVTDTGNSAQGLAWYNGSLITSGSVKDAMGNIHI